MEKEGEKRRKAIPYTQTGTRPLRLIFLDSYKKING